MPEKTYGLTPEAKAVQGAFTGKPWTPTAAEPLLKPVSVFDLLTHPSQPPEFAWDGYLPCAEVSLLGAHGGVGKSTIALMLAVCTALGRPLFGADTKPCKVLFVSLEDGTGIVRHRLAGICKAWLIDPAQLQNKLFVVDGTEHPELFSSDSRDGGSVTQGYRELHALVKGEGFGLIVIDNASDAFGGDEIVRRQVRAFIRSLKEIAKLSAAAVLLLAHVDKGTSRQRKAEGNEAYSGSTAWHNSVRSRLFLTRGEDGLLSLEHQKSNHGKLREPLTLSWVDGGLPQLVESGGFTGTHQQGRADDDKAVSLLKLIAEFESRGQYFSPKATARTNPYAMLKSEPAFIALKLGSDGTKRVITQCQRAGWIESIDYQQKDRHQGERWTVTADGRAFAGLPAATAATAATCHVTAVNACAATAATCLGGMGELAPAEVAAKAEAICE